MKELFPPHNTYETDTHEYEWWSLCRINATEETLLSTWKRREHRTPDLPSENSYAAYQEATEELDTEQQAGSK